MSNKDAKLVRKQLVNAIQETIKDNAWIQENQKVIERELKKHIDARLDAITKTITDTLQKIDERSKDINNLILRSQTKVGSKEGT